MIDGATDSAVLELEVVYVRYLNAGGIPKNMFLSIEDVKNANAEGVLEAVNEGTF